MTRRLYAKIIPAYSLFLEERRVIMKHPIRVAHIIGKIVLVQIFNEFEGVKEV